MQFEQSQVNGAFKNLILRRKEGVEFGITDRPAQAAQKQHIVDDLKNLGKHFGPDSLDLILCNGVFGWGLDAKADVEEAFRACCDCLREGGVLVVGWDDIEERRPFLLQECQSLRALKPFFFPPLGAAEYLTDTPYRHTFTFYFKQ